MDNITIDKLITIMERESVEQKNTAEYLEGKGELKCYIDVHNVARLRCEQLIECLKELKKYKDLENQGLLKQFPCKEGDTVYKIINQRDNFDNIPYKIATAVEFRLSMFGEIGKTVFLSKIDAEQKLKELKGAD